RPASTRRPTSTGPREARRRWERGDRVMLAERQAERQYRRAGVRAAPGRRTLRGPDGGPQPGPEPGVPRRAGEGSVGAAAMTRLAVGFARLRSWMAGLPPWAGAALLVWLAGRVQPGGL